MNDKKKGEKNFSSTKPLPWRFIDPGLCLEGRCVTTNGRCAAHNKMVMGNFKMGKFEISSSSIFLCPMCRHHVRAEKLGLNRCQWRLINTNKWMIVGEVYQIYNLNHNPIDIEVRPIVESNDILEDCTICLLPMDKKNKCSILPCKHLFHTECIHNWIDAEEDTSLQCPICRRNIFE